MQLLNLRAGQGKTQQAIRHANKTGAYLVVRDMREATRLSKYTHRFPITFEELLKDKLRGSMIKNIVIDNADDLIQYITKGLKIEFMTANFNTGSAQQGKPICQTEILVEPMSSKKIK